MILALTSDLYHFGALLDDHGTVSAFGRVFDHGICALTDSVEKGLRCEGEIRIFRPRPSS